MHESRSLRKMNNGSHPLWIVLCVVAAFSIAALAEIVAAIFSRRVRSYMVKHPIARFLWFALALLFALLLIPAPSTRHGGF
ncbi:MAG TPA: hypothetical protein VKY92_20395 [Verrucomicrobiae bacterium]|nr:hypothetical protein [Verrucomicrobiae bacterium]